MKNVPIYSSNQLEVFSLDTLVTNVDLNDCLITNIDKIDKAKRKYNSLSCKLYVAQHSEISITIIESK